MGAQVIYTLGLRNLGELYLAPRTLYEFRERLYRYTVEHPGQDDLIPARARVSGFLGVPRHILEPNRVGLSLVKNCKQF